MANTCSSNYLKRALDIRWLTVVLLCLLVGCDQQSAEPAEKQHRAVSMVLTDVQGVERSLVDYQGRWIVVNYWATWCPPCLEEIPELARLYDKDVMVWGVNSEDISLIDLIKFAKKYHIRYPLFQVPPDSPSVLGAIPGIPTTYLISPRGEVVARHVGRVTVKKLDEFIQGYVNK